MHARYSRERRLIQDMLTEVGNHVQDYLHADNRNISMLYSALGALVCEYRNEVRQDAIDEIRLKDD